jgi:ABC-2 type transport system ATP-binding protein
VPTLLRELDAAGVTLESVEVHRPTLDDVFLTLTGRSLRDAEAASEAKQGEGADDVPEVPATTAGLEEAAR